MQVETVSFQDDFSRADLMTPFSLSVAAEKAIANAKSKLDEMDSRLLKARNSIRIAQRQSLQSIVPGASGTYLFRGPGGRLIPDGVDPTLGVRRRGQSMTVTKNENQNQDQDLEEEEHRALEMKKLRDDLRSLRSRMSHTRAISETLNLTPPRAAARRSRQVSSVDGGSKDAAFTVLDQFPAPPNIDRRSVDQLTTTTSTSNSQRNNVVDDDDDDDIPVIATENPFSPRPYSSQSILTPLASDPDDDSDDGSETSTPKQTSLATSDSRSDRCETPTLSMPNVRPSARPFQKRDSISGMSFITANESFTSLMIRDTDTPNTQWMSSSSAEYSDADTSLGTQSPDTRPKILTPPPTTTTTTTTSSFGRSRDSSMMRPGSSMSTYSFGSLTGLAQLGNTEQRRLLGRVESALARITSTQANTDEERRRQRRLEAALAILEEDSS